MASGPASGVTELHCFAPDLYSTGLIQWYWYIGPMIGVSKWQWCTELHRGIAIRTGLTPSSKVLEHSNLVQIQWTIFYLFFFYEDFFFLFWFILIELAPRPIHSISRDICTTCVVPYLICF